MNTVTITPLRRQIHEQMELRPLPGPRSLTQKVQARALSTLSVVAPALSLDVLYRLYFTPRRYRPSREERLVLEEAAKRTVDVLGRKVRVYAWGDEPDFPWEHAPTKTAWLVHGWSGAAAQMTALVGPLLATGHRVFAFDWPAHGGSAGEQTTVAEAAEILRALTEGSRPRIFGHSLGGSAALIAAARGLDAEAFVLVAPGARLDRYPLRFTRAAGVSDAIGGALRRRLLEEFGEDVIIPGAAPALDRSVGTPALLVHDVDDQEMPHDDSRELAARFIGSQLISTAGLGHRRILRDQPVIDEITRFCSALS